MGVCLSTANKTNKFNVENQIKTEQKDQIERQLSQIQMKNNHSNTVYSNLQNCKSLSFKEKRFSDQFALENSQSFNISQSLPIPKNHRQQTGNSKFHSVSKQLNNINNLEEIKDNKSVQNIFFSDLRDGPKPIKQTAKNRNEAFNQGNLLNQGLRPEDNTLIQRTLNISQPIKLQAIQLIIGATYMGEWKNGMRHGKGIQVWQEGSKYEGQWFENQIDGSGKLVYNDGDIYEGEWKNDYYHGYGKYVLENGQIYEGEWFQGKKQGNGIQIWEDGQSYQGQFKEGEKHGKGIIRFKDDSYYDGQFEYNEINGQGKYVWLHSREYEGEWQKNKMQGWGVLKWADGSCYKGYFSNDKRQGKGEMIYTDGSKYFGNWENGKEDGYGELYEGAILKYGGPWKDGKKVKKHKFLTSNSIQQSA